jgi:phospholipid transport system substrate-binding protein
MRIRWLWTLSTLLALPALAQDSSPAEVVSRTTDQIMTAVDEQRDRYDAHPEELRSRLDELLAARVDYPRIVRGVVGEHRDELSDAEIERFSEVFRESMIRLYSDALVSFQPKKIDVGNAKVDGPRAQVGMQVSTQNGDRFNVSYSMADTGEGWKVVNILLEGVNLGMTYRNQFASLMQSHHGNVERVIQDWMKTARDSTESVSSRDGSPN